MNYYQQPCFGYGQPVVPQPYVQQPFVQQPFVQQPFVPGPFNQPMFPDQQMMPGMPGMPGATSPTEQSYIENILRLNVGKVATVYMNFENSQWGSKIFKGTILAAGKDHLILKDLNSETRFLLLSIYLDYVTFDEEVNYEYPFRKQAK